MSDPYDIAAQRLLPTKIDAIRRFWDQFCAHSEDLDGFFTSGQVEADRVSQIMSPLEQVEPNLMWEFGPSEKGHAICITAEWRNDLRATARAVINMAPEMTRFAVTDARTGNNADAMAENFSARFRMPITLSSISCTAGTDNKVEMIGTGPGSKEQIGNEVLAIATYLMGETRDRDWIGDVVPKRLKSGFLGIGRKPAPLFDPEDFLSSFEATVDEIREGLPTLRRAEADDDEERMLLKFGGAAPHSGRDDLIVFNTTSEAYARAAISTTRFSSLNHSRHNEWFAFLRVPRTAETPFDKVDDRYALEELVHQTLAPNNLGGFMAGGHGTDAVYIDMALEQIDTGLGKVSEVLSDHPEYGDMTVHFLEAGLPETGFPLSSFQTATN